MRYHVTLRRGGRRQVYDAQYGSRADAVFGVLRKESAMAMAESHDRHRGDAWEGLPLEIVIRRATGDDVVNEGFRNQRRAKGCDRVR